MKKVFTSICLFLFLFCSQERGVQFQEIDLDKALKLAKETNKMLLIDFWADG